MDTTAHEKLAIGRCGEYDPQTHALDLEARRPSKTAVYEVTGLNESFELKKSAIYGQKYDMSGSGNGREKFTNLRPGVYLVSRAISSSNREDTVLFEVVPGEIDGKTRRFRDFTADAYKSFLAEKFPIDAQAAQAEQALRSAAYQAARDVVAEVLEERKSFTPVELDGYTAVPEFAEVSDHDIVGRILRRMREQTWEEQRDAFVVQLSAADHYVVMSPFAKAASPEAAIAAARQLDEERAKDRKAAAQSAADLGLPALTGSPKQVAWALTIRARVAAKDPSLPALKKATTARYWIDNHRSA